MITHRNKTVHDIPIYQSHADTFNMLRQNKNHALSRLQKPKQLSTLKQIIFFSLIIKGLTNTINFGLCVYIWMGLSQFAQAAASMCCISILVDVLNVMRLPLIFILSLSLRHKTSLTPPKAVRWVYSTLSLSLSITALLMPEISAPILVFLMVCTVLDACFLLSKALYVRYKEQQKIVYTERIYQTTYAKLLKREEKITKLITQQSDPQKIEKNVERYKTDLCQAQKMELRLLKSKQKLCKNDEGHLIDKMFILTLSLLGFTAALLLLSIPPLGLALFSITSGIAFLYLVARLVIEILWPLNIIPPTEALNAIRFEATKALYQPLQDSLYESPTDRKKMGLKENRYAIFFHSKSFKTAPKETSIELDIMEDTDYRDPPVLSSFP